MGKIAIINAEAPKEIIDGLTENNLKPILLPPSNLVEKPISGHVDLQIFIHKNNIFCHPNIDKSFLKQIENHCNIIICKKKLSSKYPHDIPYNIAIVGKFIFHKLKYTDNSIKTYLERKNILLIDVNQGYSKCSTLIVDDNSIITADNGIHEKALNNKLNSLLISPGNIDLPDYNYGFIGGASGSDNESIFLTGSLENHKDKKKIEIFIKEQNKNIIYLSSKKIIDIGSIFIL